MRLAVAGTSRATDPRLTSSGMTGMEAWATQNDDDIGRVVGPTLVQISVATLRIQVVVISMPCSRAGCWHLSDDVSLCQRNHMPALNRAELCIIASHRTSTTMSSTWPDEANKAEAASARARARIRVSIA